MNDADLLAGFDAGTLRRFPHEDHLRVVYLMLQEGDEREALARVTAGIRAMAAASGKTEAFHVTRTAAWTRIIASLAAGDSAGRVSPEAGSRDAPAPDSAAFLAAHPELLRRDLLSNYYSDALLTSDAARTTFVAPDLAPLP